MARNIDVTLTLNTKGFNRKLKNAEASMAGFGGKANVAKGSIIGLAARFAPLAAAVVGVTAAFKGLSASVGAARQIQDIGVVLKNIVGDAEGGAMALQQVRDIATELPFAFEEIAGATPALATVSANLQELEDNTKLAADIAAVTGLSFADASSQIQRAFSAGAGAADMFREKGVLSMAGFEAGASYSIEETRKKFREFGKTVEGAANDLNTTLTGSLSQAGDRLFQFQSSLGDAIVPEFTAFINALTGVFDDNKESINAFAKSFGEGIVNAFYTVLEVGAVVVDYFSMLFNALKSVATFVNEKFGDVFYVVFNSIAKVVGGVVEAVAFLGKGIGKIIELAGGSDDVTKFFDNIQNAANKVRTEGLDKFGEALDDMFDAVPETKAQDFVKDLIEQLREAGKIADEEAAKIAAALENQEDKANTKIQAGANQLTNSLSDYKSASEELLSTFSSATEKLSDDLATALLSGQDVMSSFKDFFKTIIKEIIAQALRLAVIQPLLSSIFGAFGFNIGFTGSGGIDSITKRERGGNVMRNKPYLVGEKGPELMVPLTSGSIVPNDALGGSGSRNFVTYNINAVDARSFKQLVAQDPEFIYNVTRVGERRLPA